MSENKEFESVTQEEWVVIPQEIQDELNLGLANDGFSFLRSTGEGFLLDNSTDSKRTDKVVSAIQLSINSLSSDKVMNGVSPTSKCGLTGFTHEGRVVISFNKLESDSLDVYVRERNTLLAKANEILTTFDQKPLPAYTSQGRKSL